uniref:Uncharacterized protein n=1 Tax=Megaselia scalaris TaxID=36166 RepID=T1GSK3_MEGSC
MLKNGTYHDFGIERPCKFNELENFHVIVNIIVDIMHDLILGVLRYDLNIIFKHFMSIIDLDEVNARIKKWNFGNKETIRISPIKINNINSRSGIQCLSSTEFGTNELLTLDLLIKEHNSFYKDYAQMNITPKFHFLLHCEDVNIKNKKRTLTFVTTEGTYLTANKQTYIFTDFILNFNPDCLNNFTSNVKQKKISLEKTVLESIKLFLRNENITYSKLTYAEKVMFKGTYFGADEFLIINENSWNSYS